MPCAPICCSPPKVDHHHSLEPTANLHPIPQRAGREHCDPCLDKKLNLANASRHTFQVLTPGHKPVARQVLVGHAADYASAFH
eukprot:14714600-Alexandrium_andersonii.AAC.1